MPTSREDPFDDPLQPEQFDFIVRQLLPTLRERRPDLSDVELLREAARLAEERLRSDGRLHWGPPRL